MIEKYKLLDESLKALSQSVINLLILRGDPGFGKTHTTLEYVNKNKINYEYINTYATPLSFYQILFKKRNKDVIIFDDLQSINDPKIKAMFKAICWESEDGKRIVNYHSTSGLLKDLELPDSFEISANIILIFNTDLHDFESIVNRGITIDFKFDFKESIEIIDSFKEKAKIDDEVLEYVKKECNEATENLSIRSLVILSKLKEKGFDFKIFAKEVLKVNDNISELIKCDEKAWCDKTGMHRASYYRKKKKYRIK